MDTLETLHDKLQRLKAASKTLHHIDAKVKNDVLRSLADALRAHEADLQSANELDLVQAKHLKLNPSLVDRLTLNSARIQALAKALDALAHVDDPIGQVIETLNRPNGLRIEKKRVPLGVVGLIFEARPNVTVDAFGLAFKTSNGLFLRGGKEALNTNLALVKLIQQVLRDHTISDQVIQILDNPDRHLAQAMMKAHAFIDVLIPRGSAMLIQEVVQSATIPVLETGAGNCHIYVEASAHLDQATAILLNAKIQRPSVCNAVETILVDAAIAPTYLPSLLDSLKKAGVEVRGCPHACLIDPSLTAANEDDWSTEYLDLIVALKIVQNTSEAIEHIQTYTTHHSEAILTENEKAKEQFFKAIDAAVLYHNASTRFTDGFEFGFEAEMGISTQKLHARGPMGLLALTSYTYHVNGTYQTRT